jgi:hypothetical protein
VDDVEQVEVLERRVADSEERACTEPHRKLGGFVL